MTVDSSPPENELFDPFFDNIQIQKCLDLIKSYSAYVFGNRVLQTLDETHTLEIRHITLFMQSCALKEHGIDSWHAFLVNQGYSVDVKDGGANLLQSKVSRPSDFVYWESNNRTWLTEYSAFCTIITRSRLKFL